MKSPDHQLIRLTNAHYLIILLLLCVSSHVAVGGTLNDQRQELTIPTNISSLVNRINGSNVNEDSSRVYCELPLEAHRFESLRSRAQLDAIPNALERRVKRSYSHERHIELMVVVDSKMVQYHGDNLRHYVLTLMATVSDTCMLNY